MSGSWSSNVSDQYQWIQVDLGKLHEVHGVITQGRNEYIAPDGLIWDQWVTSYEILYSVDGNHFQPTKNSNCQVTNFVGNSDHDTMVTNILSDPVYAQFVRVHPTDWYSHISLRFEVLGCSADKMAEHSTYYKSLNFHRSITTQNSTGSCIRCAVKCMRAPECKYFKCDGGCHLYTCSKEDNVVAFQFGSYIPFN
ncbi:EGF-like repeat and discoidin I-like domain-containing protein 3 isoform X1 [Anneissia japonica]|uniref:EGF-like repeat and discoidin I-like domain-containing protein 3 isoform X1 n=1 Tax=Anneissia japonica TaxID=1529436 RepID=UPI0014259205|nr:EGF-like repeat and discoidin I-like domain-containing protein 3 isoform X1 [Anneissia japonica]